MSPPGADVAAPAADENHAARRVIHPRPNAWPQAQEGLRSILGRLRPAERLAAGRARDRRAAHSANHLSADVADALYPVDFDAEVRRYF